MNQAGRKEEMNRTAVETQNNFWSACCGASIYPDSDICSSCGERCTAEGYCSNCEGTGKIDVVDQSRVTSRTISPPYITIDCEDCEGEGVVVVEIEL